MMILRRTISDLNYLTLETLVEIAKNEGASLSECLFIKNYIGYGEVELELEIRTPETAEERAFRLEQEELKRNKEALAAQAKIAKKKKKDIETKEKRKLLYEQLKAEFEP